ncbi:MAG: choice-of-anchor A family protein [Ignavibacteriales bacterium]|nr:choice-of-anchor A family protein [Ignavibacteriales bacterium]MCF8307025.1 choice-of-anchor A family protein [Ignavibacteriales bacterium]MCF8316647.1 choice-of-anchor A family protein [Ignavibacteriales bacterium]MCF8438304.1 choice-of-anchor A family protein [Ignavibacteriales bacterium]
MRKIAFTILIIISIFASVTTAKDSNKNLYQKIQDGTVVAIVTGLSNTTNVTIFNPVLGQNGTYATGTFSGTVDGSPAKFYCIDLGHNLVYNQTYVDSGSTGAEITYILNNYFPHVALPYPGGLPTNTEAAAVQCAIWHYSDGLDINTISNGTVRDRAQAIADDAALNAGQTSPVKTLEIVPVSSTLAQGVAGEFVIEAYDWDNSPVPNITVTLSATGDATLSTLSVVTNANGVTDPITLTPGVDLNSIVTASAEVTIPHGTRFYHQANSGGYQKLVLATPEQGTKEVNSAFNWVPDIDLGIQKIADVTNPVDGDIVNFTITVTNPSAYNATGVLVSDILPLGMVFQSAVPAPDYDANTGIWTVGTVPAGGSKSLIITVEMDYGILNAAPFDLGDAADYNVFVYRDYTAPSSDTQGKLAVGRNLTLSNYSVGDQLPNSHGADDVLVVGRKITYTSGAVYNGNVVYGRFKDFNENAVSISDGTLRKDTVLDFAATQTYLQGLSNTLKAYTVNGTTVFEWGHTLTLTGTDPFLNTFFVDGNDLDAATTVTITVPNGSVVLVNVNRKVINWSGGFFVYGTDYTNVLYNFYQATDLTISNIDVTGSILAPRARVNFISGVQNGQMMCKFLEGMGQFNHKPFIGNVPIDPYIPNAAEIIALDQYDPNTANNLDDQVIAVQVIPNPNNGGNPTVQWQLAGTLPTNQFIWTIIEDNNNELVAGTWGGAVLRSVDNGLTWTQINSAMFGAYVWTFAQKTTGDLFSGCENGLFKSVDNGVTWTATTLTGKDVRALVIDPQNDDIMYAGTWGFGVYKSIDGGATWNAMNDGMIFTAVHALAMTSNSTLYAGTFGGGVYRYNTGSSAWDRQPVGYDHVWTLAVTNNDKLYAGTYGGGVYFSADGTTWSNVTGNLGNNYVYAIRIDGANNVYTSTWMSGVYVSTAIPKSAGLDMAWANLGMNGIEVSTIFVDSKQNKIYAATGDGTLYVADLVTSIDNNPGEVKTFSLDQNYPNPFNPTTTIRYSIAEDSRVSIRVFDLLGREVAVLVDRNQSAGVYNVNFDASQLSSGVYLYRIEAGNFSSVRKLMLLK